MKIQICSFMVVTALVACAEAATIAETPRAFLGRLYAAYGPNGRGNNFSYPEARAIVDSSLLKLLRHDQMMSKEEVGALDGDPICQCQDWGAFKVLSIHNETSAPSRATGEVAFSNTGQKHSVHFALVLENGAWKIHDIASHDMPSLQAYLRTYKY